MGKAAEQATYGALLFEHDDEAAAEQARKLYDGMMQGEVAEEREHEAARLRAASSDGKPAW